MRDRNYFFFGRPPFAWYSGCDMEVFSQSRHITKPEDQVNSGYFFFFRNICFFFSANWDVSCPDFSLPCQSVRTSHGNKIRQAIFGPRPSPTLRRSAPVYVFFLFFFLFFKKIFLWEFFFYVLLLSFAVELPCETDGAEWGCGVGQLGDQEKWGEMITKQVPWENMSRKLFRVKP